MISNLPHSPPTPDGMANVLDEKLASYLDSCSVEVLEEAQNYIETLLASKISDTSASLAYDQIREAFCKKFAQHQVEAFRVWRTLKPVKQAQFNKSWRRAIKFFKTVDKRFEDNEKLTQTIIWMVIDSPYFHGRLLFADLLETLNQMNVLFDSQFPGYRDNPDALDKLVIANT